jgi:hypothetical protein
MRDVVKSRAARWLQAGWVLPLALLMLPNCALDSSGTLFGEPGDPNFKPGATPQSGAIMCDIPKVPAGGGAFDCLVDPADLEGGMPLTYAAVALAQGETFGSLGLDYSADAISACGENTPRKIEFHGELPKGYQLCLNCAQIPAEYVDPTAACVAKCVDLVIASENKPTDGAQTWCQANAKVSTNFTETCIGDACTNNGMPKAFDDPRKYQEPVTWDVLGNYVQVSGDELIKSGDDGTVGNWDGGAASTQIIKSGDAWVEFEVKEINNVSHVLGVASGAVDTSSELEDVGYAISLNWDGNIYIIENFPTYVSAPIGTYQPQDRFRIKIKDNHDGTASISYKRLDGPCQDGTVCLEEDLGTQTQPSLSYPLRINASFREPGATFKKVSLVRIQQP